MNKKALKYGKLDFWICNAIWILVIALIISHYEFKQNEWVHISIDNVKVQFKDDAIGKISSFVILTRSEKGKFSVELAKLDIREIVEQWSWEESYRNTGELAKQILKRINEEPMGKIYKFLISSITYEEGK